MKTIAETYVDTDTLPFDARIAAYDEATGNSLTTTFLSDRADAAGLRDRAGRKLPIGPGMTADVNLLGDKRTVMAYILTPFTRLSETAMRE